MEGMFFSPTFHLELWNCMSLPPLLRISKFKDPPPIRISMKLFDTAILIYTMFKILLGI